MPRLDCPSPTAETPNPKTLTSFLNLGILRPCKGFSYLPVVSKGAEGLDSALLGKSGIGLSQRVRRFVMSFVFFACFGVFERRVMGVFGCKASSQNFASSSPRC